MRLIKGMPEKEYNKAYYEANRDKIAERHKAYREANKDKIAERKKAYYEANKDKIKAYYEANKDKIAEQAKAYREANRDKIKAYREARTLKEKIMWEQMSEKEQFDEMMKFTKKQLESDLMKEKKPKLYPCLIRDCGRKAEYPHTFCFYHQYEVNRAGETL